MEFNDRRDGEGLAHMYEIPTRHSKVANNMLVKHLAKSGVPTDGTVGIGIRREDWATHGTGPEGHRSIETGHWDSETNSGWQRVMFRGSSDQHDALAKRWKRVGHLQDGYGRGN